MKICSVTALVMALSLAAIVGPRVSWAEAGIAIAEPPPPTGADAEALLRLAFDTASAIPVMPHEKDRARAQEEVVAAAIDNGRLDLAEAWVERIDTWRRGSAYADLAFALAAGGDRPEVRRYLVLAAAIADREADWRRDRIRMKIARVHARLGETAEAARIGATLPESEVGKLAEVRIESMPLAAGDEQALVAAERKAFEQEIEALDRILASQMFDPTRHALDAFVALHARQYADESRRDLLEARIRGGWNLVPVDIRIDLLLRLARNAQSSGDLGTSRRLVADATAMAEAGSWIAEHEVPLLGRLADASQRAGNGEEARRLAAKAIEVFDAKRETIFDIYRAGALRPVAEAYAVMGDRESAAAIYRRAIEEGFGNPNARPRALDLSATCLSMASSGTLPDEGTATRLREIRGLLGDPW
jgi:tetratricopeptide (TPR) repeat protein